MLRSVWGKTLWEGRGGLLGWTLAIAAVTILYGAFYPLMAQEAFAQVMDAFPEGLTAAFGWSDLTSPAGYLGGTVFGLLAPILLIVWAIGMGARAIAGEEEAGTLDLLLAHPVSRSRVVVERTLALATAVAIASATVFLAMIAIRVPAQLDALPIAHIAATCVHLALLGIAFGALTLAAGAATGSRALAAGFGAFVAVVGYFGNTVARQVDALAFLETVSLFRYYAGGDPLRHGLQAGDAAVLLASALAFVAIAVVGLRRRDVAV
jgi:ABC-2 type transport system permease protein